MNVNIVSKNLAPYILSHDNIIFSNIKPSLKIFVENNKISLRFHSKENKAYKKVL